MPESREQSFLQALSFLSPELRRALAAAPDGTACGALPRRQVALLWCDISGFSRHTAEFLSAGAEGVDRLHREIDTHYDKLIETILSHGGEPVTFVGDGLLSVWPVETGGMAAAVESAIGTACALVRSRANGDARFNLNHHVSCGEFQTVELGGRHGRWLSTSVGSALKELERIADIKAPNEVVLTAEAATFCALEAVSAPMGRYGARRLLRPQASRRLGKTSLAVPPPAAWNAALARMPRFAAGWIETVGLKYLAELRPVTSVSVVLHGFDQSAVGGANRLNEVVQSIQDIVHRRDGYVAEVTVDEKGVSVLITFGTPPDAHSDDPLRSVLSGREILEALSQRGLRSSVGVATGRMLCCIVGNADRRCDLVLGDALIRSTRLATTTQSGMLVDETTMQATRNMMSYGAEPLMLLFKGASREAPAWAPQLDQQYARASEEISGRDREIAKLLDCWNQRAQDGIRHVVIEGESGLGKTSLALQLRDIVTLSGGQFKFEAASAIEQDAPFSALRRLVMESLDVLPLMSAEARQKAIMAKLPERLRPAAPFLNAVFPSGLEETEFTATLTGQARAEHIQGFVVDLLFDAFAGQPTCLCVDDAQWLDTETHHVLARLAKSAPDLMIVILAQPKQTGSWSAFADDAGFTHLSLGPLSQDGLLQLIVRNLGCDSVDQSLLEQISVQTECHPFYTAEVLRNLMAADAVVISNGQASLARADALATAALPDTVHGMVLQRLDKLEPSDQLSLRVASVAGLSFPTKLVCALDPLERSAKDMSQQLDHQVTQGFLRVQNALNSPGFAFSHGIVREVAHSQLPRAQSRRLHAKAAEWIERHSGEDRVSRLLELAHHWMEAGLRPRAVSCLVEEALRLFSQGFAVDAVQVGLRAMRVAGVDVPEGPEALTEATQRNMAVVAELTEGRHPTELLTKMRQPPADLLLKFQTILSTAPFAFQSNQFPVFAWASSAAMRLVMENVAGPPHAFSMYSIVQSLLTGDRAAGAAWSRAALDLDAATEGNALPAAAFIDMWFHGHWRDPLQESVETNRIAVERALADNDLQYASYNIAGGVILKAALGYPLADVISQGAQALQHPLHRNALVHVHLEMQFARALRGETHDLLSLSDEKLNEDKDIGWVTETEFANQIGFYLATRARLHRHAGDWIGALDWYERVVPVRPAIAGQMIEFDLVLHAVLARLGQVLADPAVLEAQRGAIEAELSQLTEWSAIHPQNFGAKAKMANLVWAGVEGDISAADGLATLARAGDTQHWLQDRALAFEYAARLQPDTGRVNDAIQAYKNWGASAVAQRFAERGLN